MVSTFNNYTLIARDMDTSVKRKAAEPIVARETAYYEANIGKVKTIDDFLGNRRLYAYAMKAHGLEDMIYAKAFMKKVLTEGVETKSTFANRLADDRYIDFAKAFNFARYADITTTLPAAVEETKAAYLRNAIETDAGNEDTGTRLALYFARKASTLTGPYDILGDAALSQVANTVAGLPASSGATSAGALERRAELIASKVDIKSFKDPAKVEAFVKRFSAIWDAQNNVESAPVLTLFNGANSGVGLNADMLLSLQRVRSRG